MGWSDQGYNDGYYGSGKPSNSDWNAFNHGQEARRQEDAFYGRLRETQEASWRPSSSFTPTSTYTSPYIAYSKPAIYTPPPPPPPPYENICVYSETIPETFSGIYIDLFKIVRRRKDNQFLLHLHICNTTNQNTSVKLSKTVDPITLQANRFLPIELEIAGSSSKDLLQKLKTFNFEQIEIIGENIPWVQNFSKAYREFQEDISENTLNASYDLFYSYEDKDLKNSGHPYISRFYIRQNKADGQFALHFNISNPTNNPVIIKLSKDDTAITLDPNETRLIEFSSKKPSARALIEDLKTFDPAQIQLIGTHNSLEHNFSLARNQFLQKLHKAEQAAIEKIRKKEQMALDLEIKERRNKMAGYGTIAAICFVTEVALSASMVENSTIGKAFAILIAMGIWAWSAINAMDAWASRPGEKKTPQSTRIRRQPRP